MNEGFSVQLRPERLRPVAALMVPDAGLRPAAAALQDLFGRDRVR